MVSVTPVPVKRAGPSDEPRGSVSSSLKRGRLNEFGHKKHEVSGTQEGLHPLELRLCPSLFAVTVVVVLVGVWHGGVLFVVVLTQPPNYSSKPPPTTSARSQVQNLREETLIGPAGVSAHPRPIRGQRGRRRSGGVSASLRSPCCDGEGSGGGAFPPDWGMGSQTPGLLLHLYC